MRTLLRISLAAAGLAAATPSAWAGSWIEVTPVSGSEVTVALGINDSNIVTGYYIGCSGCDPVGFVGPIDGSHYKSFDDPGGVTEPRAINDAGTITGYDAETTDTWEHSPKGKLTSVTMNGTALEGIAQGLNKKGVFGASYGSGDESVSYLGKKSKYKSEVDLTIENAGSAARGVNDAGDVVGFYYDPSTGYQHGFLIVKGEAPQINYPGATSTVVEGINDKGIATGQWTGSEGVVSGFYYTIKSGTYTDLYIPGSESGTEVFGVNDNDVIMAYEPVPFGGGSGGESYVYCLKSKGCPTGANYHRPPQPQQQRGPAHPDHWAPMP